MRSFVRSLLCVVAVFSPSEASATNYTLWLHGRSLAGATQPGPPQNFSEWGPASTPAGANKFSGSWEGTQTIASQNGRIRDALDCYCPGRP